MVTVTTVFDDLGGPAAVARLLALKNPSTASEMKRRDSIPPEYWPQLVAAARSSGHAHITHEALAVAHALSRGRPVPVEGAAA